MGRRGARPRPRRPPRPWRRLAPRHLRPDAAAGARGGAGAARPGAVGRPAAGHPVGQRHRAPDAGAGRHVGRRALRAGVHRLFAGLAGLRQAAPHPGRDDAGPGVRQRPRIWPRHRRRGAARPARGADRRHARGPQRAPLRRAADHRTRSAAAARPPAGGARHHRQVPVHIGLDQGPQGRHHHQPDDVRQPADAAAVPGLPGRGTAGAGGLAALEPRLRRQPQRGHHALQRRHAVHRRRQAHARRHQGDAAQPARDLAHHLLQRAQGPGGDRHRDGPRHAAARHPVQALQGLHVCRRGAQPGGVGQAARPCRGRGGRARARHHRPGHDRDGAELHLRRRHRGGQRPHRPAGARRRRQARARRRQRQDRDPLPRAQRDARLLAHARADGRGLRRGRFLPHRRRRALGRPRRPGQGPVLRRPHGRGLQAVHRHLRQRGAAARQDHRRR